MMPANEYVEGRNSNYFVAGTRVGLDVIVHEFRNGRSAEAILEAYPSIGSLAKVYGTITFILEHPKEIEAYLGDQDRRYEELKVQRPLTTSMMERIERVKSERTRRSREDSGDSNPLSIFSALPGDPRWRHSFRRSANRG